MSGLVWRNPIFSGKDEREIAANLDKTKAFTLGSGEDRGPLHLCSEAAPPFKLSVPPAAKICVTLTRNSEQRWSARIIPNR